MDTLDRYKGCLLGLAVGDAVGTTLEFKPRGTFTPIADMIGGGPFELQPGQWTDDTSMALCMAHSLLNKNGFDPADQMNRYCNWWQYGYMSSTDTCFDIGNTVLSALKGYLVSRNPFSGSPDRYSSGNGSLMRLAPIPMFYARQPELAITYSGESSRTTHGSELCIDACKYFGSLLVQILNGTEKESIFQNLVYLASTKEIDNIARGSYLNKTYHQIRGTGYVVESLEAALWCFAKSDDFREAILLAANLGDDADTTAAICGQIAGAYYGKKGIPATWLKTLYWRDDIESLAEMLCRSNEKPSP